MSAKDTERLARVAINVPPAEEAYADEYWPEYVPLVRAILQAMREPSEDMLDHIDVFERDGFRWRLRAMIDHLLSE